MTDLTSSRTGWLDRPARWSARTVTQEEFARLRPVGKRPPLREYVGDLWRYRYFIWADARAKSLDGQRGTFLGNLWLVAKPMLDASFFFIMFGVLLQTSRGIDNFIGYLIIGVTMFPPMQAAVNSGSQVMTTGKSLIRGFTFPRAALPVGYTLRLAIDFLPQLVAVLILITVNSPHAWPSWRWLLVVPVMGLQFLFCFGLVCLTAPATTRVPDLRNVWSFLTRFWFYGSGVFFTFDRFVDHPGILEVLSWNPGAVILTMYRDCLLYATTPSAAEWGKLVLWCVVTVVTGFLVFWRSEESYAVER